MLLFCDHCGNVLFAKSGEAYSIVLSCASCPFVYYVDSALASKHTCKLKEVGEVLGGPEAWKNADSTEAVCPVCSHGQAYFMQIQTRSADEPMTTFYRCCNHECSHNWRD